MSRKHYNKLPADFIQHNGSACPVHPTSFVETLINTSEGIASGQITLARMHVWEAVQHEEGLGEVIAYRPTTRDDRPRFHRKHRFTIEGIKHGTDKGVN